MEHPDRAIHFVLGLHGADYATAFLEVGLLPCEDADVLAGLNGG